MDVYHKVIAKLYEETGGSESETVDFIDLVKRAGFYSSYADIFQELSSRAWIAETGKPDWVRITHWGAKEAGKARAGTSPDQAIERSANRLLSEAREFLSLVEELQKSPSPEQVSLIEKKNAGIKKCVDDLKADL